MPSWRRCGALVLTVTLPVVGLVAAGAPAHAAVGAASATATTVSAPSWWNGDCDANHWNAVATAQGWQGAGAHRLGASYLGVPVCGPRPSIDGAPNVTWTKAGWGEYEWQCVELAMRFMAQVYGVSAYGANGNGVVRNYTSASGGALVKVDNGTAGQPPQPGDVISFDDTSGGVGHAGVVSASSVDANGNGTITMLSQNDTADGLRTLAVSAWRVQPFGSQVPYGWLHDPAGRGGTGTPTTTDPNAKYVAAAYQAFLQRPATSAEVANWAAQLDGGSPRSALTSTLSTSQEWVATQLRDLYQRVLGRDPDASGVAYWTSRVQAGMRLSDIGAFFYGSPEYFTKVGGTNDAFVASLYTNILGRAPDDGGRSYWDQQLDAGVSTFTVAGGFYASVESRLGRVAALYQTLLGRAPDAAGQSYWADQLLRVDDIVLAAFLGASDEFFNRAQI